MKYRVETATKKNTKEFDKPNEDYFLVDRNNGIFIILDGVTRDKIDGIYPDPSPACEVSKIYPVRTVEQIISINLCTLKITNVLFSFISLFKIPDNE